jgi:hypothetical protein
MRRMRESSVRAGIRRREIDGFVIDREAFGSMAACGSCARSDVVEDTAQN